MFAKSTLAQNHNLLKCLERDGYSCTRCKSKEKLIVHHIDNSRKVNGALRMNNDLTNLVTLCRPCHAWTHGQTSDYHDVQEMREMGMTFAEIGRKLGITRQAVHQYWKKHFSKSGD